MPVLIEEGSNDSACSTPTSLERAFCCSQDKAVQLVALSTLVGSFMSAGNAAAATELGQIAAGDNRFGTIALLFAPVVGWVSTQLL